MEVSKGLPAVQDGIEAPPPPPELEAFKRLTPPTAPSPFGRPITWDSGEGSVALLNNRFILGGLGVVVVLLLTAIVLVAIGQGDSAKGNAPNVSVPPGDKTPSRPIGGLAGTTKTTASYRNGPGPTYVILGTIPRGATVAVVGRNEDDSWLQVRYPPSSTLKGWVDAKLLDVEGDVTVLAIAGPGPVASADITYVPTAAIYEPVGTPTAEPAEPTRITRPTGTPTSRPSVTPYRTPLTTNTPEQFPTATVPHTPEQ